MEGWVGLVGWPIADTLATKRSHINHRSGVDTENSPAKDRRSYHWATSPTNFFHCWRWRWVLTSTGFLRRTARESADTATVSDAAAAAAAAAGIVLLRFIRIRRRRSDASFVGASTRRVDSASAPLGTVDRYVRRQRGTCSAAKIYKKTRFFSAGASVKELQLLCERCVFKM